MIQFSTLRLIFIAKFDSVFDTFEMSTFKIPSILQDNVEKLKND